MYIFAAHIFICIITLLYMLFRTKVSKSIKSIIAIIILVLLANSIIGIIKITNFREYSTLYNHPNLFYWGWWDASFIIIIAISIFFLLIILLKKILNKTQKKIDNEVKRKGLQISLLSVLGLLTIILFALSQRAVYTNSSTDLNSDINKIIFDNPNDYDAEIVKDILLDIENKTTEPSITNVIDRIANSENVRLVDYSKAQFTDPNFTVNFFIRMLEQFKLEGKVYYYTQFGRSGEFEIIELEYSLVEEQRVNDYYTIIIYGKTTLDELIVNIIGAIDEDTIYTDFKELSWTSRRYELWYEVLQENYEK
ncbi:MAG: hypothetical protein JXN65_02090 [Clostridia bacterium]|nr:hypothetical protein [Clostridia bacterium]